jgi:hypothetical protein
MQLRELDRPARSARQTSALFFLAILALVVNGQIDLDIEVRKPN